MSDYVQALMLVLELLLLGTGILIIAEFVTQIFEWRQRRGQTRGRMDGTRRARWTR